MFLYEHFLDYLGQFGPWQKWTLLQCSLAAMGEAMITFMFYFVMYLPDNYR